MKRIEIFLKNLILNILLLIKRKQESNSQYSYKGNSKILFIRLNRIGDALVTTPLLHQIKLNLKSTVYVLADKTNFLAFKNNPDVDKLIIFEKGIKGFSNILHFIKEENIDTVVDLHDDVSTTVSFIVAFCKAQNKFGFEKRNKILYTKTIKIPDGIINHKVDRTLEFSKLFGITVDKSKIKIQYFPTAESLTKVERFISEHYPQNKFLAGINISAGSRARFWGVENYKSLLNFFSNYEINVLMFSSPNDVPLIQQITGNKYPFLAGSFDEFAAGISRLNFLFTPDTAAIHLASAFDVPVFGIYLNYKTVLAWPPYNSIFDYVVREDSEIKNIPFEEVKTKLLPFLDKCLTKVNDTL